MKRLAVMAALILFLGGGSLDPAGARVGGGRRVGSAGDHRPKAKLVSTRVNDQRLRIENDLKAGKLTQAQAKVALAALRSINSRLTGYMRQSEGADLTDEQADQLNKSLDENSKAINPKK